MALGQIQTTRGPQILVLGSCPGFHFGPLGTLFDPHPHVKTLTQLKLGIGVDAGRRESGVPGRFGTSESFGSQRFLDAFSWFSGGSLVCY